MGQVDSCDYEVTEQDFKDFCYSSTHYWLEKRGSWVEHATVLKREELIENDGEYWRPYVSCLVKLLSWLALPLNLVDYRRIIRSAKEGRLEPEAEALITMYKLRGGR